MAVSINKSAVCTLFEGHYHYGLSVLVNSLYKNNFKGSVYAGYKGDIPVWASAAKHDLSLAWSGAYTLEVESDIQIHFLPIVTEFHLTNYKPYFMLKLFNGIANNVDSISYFDPDIVIKCKWSFFESWTAHGVALVHEIVSNDMPSTHPLRMEWGKVIEKANKIITRNLTSYFNGGFFGVAKVNIKFLEDWANITETGIKYFGLTPGQWDANLDRTNLFFMQDQDALNITAMCTEVSISEMGPEAMDFVPGGFTMSHSVGPSKPWRKNYLLSVLNGIGPSPTDKAYWKCANIPIAAYPQFKVSLKKLSIKISSFIVRFYKRH